MVKSRKETQTQPPFDRPRGVAGISLSYSRARDVHTQLTRAMAVADAAYLSLARFQRLGLSV
jgi:hypothetical protein